MCKCPNNLVPPHEVIPNRHHPDVVRRCNICDTEQAEGIWLTANQAKKLKAVGDYNHAPINLKPANEADIVNLFHSVPIVFQEWRQIFYSNKGKRLLKPIKGTLYWAPGLRGYIMEMDYQAAKMNWYTFYFCKHKDTDSKSCGRCCTTYTCKSCGYQWTIDSSD